MGSRARSATSPGSAAGTPRRSAPPIARAGRRVRPPRRRELRARQRLDPLQRRRRIGPRRRDRNQHQQAARLRPDGRVRAHLHPLCGTRRRTSAPLASPNAPSRTKMRPKKIDELLLARMKQRTPEDPARAALRAEARSAHTAAPRRSRDKARPGGAGEESGGRPHHRSARPGQLR